jgi:broad specificity phosphatase PhoE
MSRTPVREALIRLEADAVNMWGAHGRRRGTMTTRLLLVRHGATILSAEDRFAGSTDVDLSEEGRDQARGLAERLAQKPLSAAFASPMKRTIETASIVARRTG